jgi:hypothetical protein
MPLEAVQRFRQGDTTPKPWDGDLVQRIASNDPPFMRQWLSLFLWVKIEGSENTLLFRCGLINK